MNKEIVQVVILEGGKTCMELNGLPKPNILDWETESDYEDALDDWQEAESKLRTWEIENHDITFCFQTGNKCGFPCFGDCKKEGLKLEVGQEFKAEIINEKAVIV